MIEYADDVRATACIAECEFKFNLLTVQQDATYSVYYISVRSSTCFGS